MFVVGEFKEDISDYKERCYGNTLLAKIDKISQKAIISVAATYACRVWFDIGFMLSTNSSNSSVTLPYTRDKAALPWQPILGLKLLYMHFYDIQ